MTALPVFLVFLITILMFHKSDLFYRNNALKCMVTRKVSCNCRGGVLSASRETVLFPSEIPCKFI